MKEVAKGKAWGEEVMEVLGRVAWEMGDEMEEIEEAMQVIPLNGAMTNQVFQIKWQNDGVWRRVLMRLYGQGVDVFFDRDDEVRTFQCVSEHGQGPRLLARFAAGRVEEFLYAKVRTNLFFFFYLAVM